MRRPLKIVSICLALVVLCVGGLLLAVQRSMDSLSGPVYRFPVPAGEAILTDNRAAALAREVMNRDGLPETEWRLMEDDRTKAPDGQPDRYMARNQDNPNRGVVSFLYITPRTRQRFVSVELRDGEFVVQGTFGK